MTIRRTAGSLVGPKLPRERGCGFVVLLLVLAGCQAKPVAVPAPDIVRAADWGSRPEPVPADRRHVPRRITVHHAGVEWKPDDEPLRKARGLQTWGQREKEWPDVPYHYLVAPDGTIVEGRDLAYAGETNTEYDTSGHALVQLWGNFEEQRVPAAQLEAAVRLIAWICWRTGIAPETIAGHRDHSSQTSCPGRDLERYIAGGKLRGWVAAMLRGERVEITLLEPEPEGPTRFAGE